MLGLGGDVHGGVPGEVKVSGGMMCRVNPWRLCSR